jgi:hypothetical protein
MGSTRLMARGLRGALPVVAGAALAAGVWLVLADAERERVRRERAEAMARAHAGRVALLEDELQGALAREREVHALLTARRQAEADDREARADRERQALAPPPEGVRLALAALAEVLGRSGHRLRFLEARALAGHALHDVEVFEPPSAATRGAGVLWLAARATFNLERAAGVLTIRFHSGTVSRGGERSDLAAAGEPLLLEGVDGRALESRLPHLVVAEGEYPQPEPRVPARARLDPFTAGRWRDRLNDLLATAATTTRYQVRELHGLDEARFHDVVLLGQSDGRLLVEAAEARRMAVVVDEATGTVELELQGGTLRRAGGDVPLPEAPDAHRVLLQGITPQAAMRTMTGMVVRR